MWLYLLQSRGELVPWPEPQSFQRKQYSKGKLAQAWCKMDNLMSSVPDSWHFGVDPDPRIRGSMPLTNGSGSGSWIRILLFLSLTFKMPAKNLFFKTIFFCLLLFEGTFTFFDERRIRIREAKKHMDPVDPDPEHCSRDKYFLSRPFKIKPAFLGVRDGFYFFMLFTLFSEKSNTRSCLANLSRNPLQSPERRLRFWGCKHLLIEKTCYSVPHVQLKSIKSFYTNMLTKFSETISILPPR